MNRWLLFLAPLMTVLVSLRGASSAGALPEVPVPVSPAPASSSPQQPLITPPGGENQSVYGSHPALVSDEAARSVSEKFRAAYGQAASPRMVIHLNRALIETPSLLRPTGKAEKSGEAHSAIDESAGAPALAVQQTAREIELLFDRVFRNAGARLVDRRAAIALLGDESGGRLVGDQGAKERDALKQIADIAIEVLISSRSLTVASSSGNTTYTVPDIQTTAIRLSDSTVLGQSAASDILGIGSSTGGVPRAYAAQEIAKATAFALMADMLKGAK